MFIITKTLHSLRLNDSVQTKKTETETTKFRNTKHGSVGTLKPQPVITASNVRRFSWLQLYHVILKFSRKTLYITVACFSIVFKNESF